MSVQTRRFIQCDVFTPSPTQGNALAVVVDGDGIPADLMQQFAAWTNLAETTFLCRPEHAEADYRVRIFSPSREMVFAGHPTLGSCAAWLHCGGVPKDSSTVYQQCEIGLVEIDISEKNRSAFVAPPTKIEPMAIAQLDAIVERLQIPRSAILHTAQLDNGPVWQVLHLDCAESVLSLDSSLVRWPEFKAVGVIGAYPPGSECDYEVRMLAPSSGMSEDPITGSLNAALAHWMQSDGRLTTSITIAQGTVIARHGRVSISPRNNPSGVLIGGQTHILIDGTVQL